MILKYVHKLKLINFNGLIITCFLSYLITESDKNYYALIFLCPSLLVLIKEFSINKDHKIISIPVLLLLISLNISNLMENLKVVFNDLPIELPYEITIDYAKTNKLNSLEIIGGQGWPFIFSNSKPKRSIVDSWMYKPENPFVTRDLLTQHKLLLNQNSGYRFWIESGLLKYKDSNKYLREILFNSEIIED